MHPFTPPYNVSPYTLYSEQLNDFDSTIERWAMLKDDLLSYDEFALLMLKIISW